MAVAPAIFIGTVLTMITGELVITHLSTPLDQRRSTKDVLKYIILLEVLGGAAGVGIIVFGAGVGIGGAHVTHLVSVSALIVVSMMFSQIAANWILLAGGRPLYAAAFDLQGLAAFAISAPLVEHFGMTAVALAYTINPLLFSAVGLVAFGPRRAFRKAIHVFASGSVMHGRRIHGQAGHQVGGLVVKTAWSSLDVLMVGAVGGQLRAGHYKILKTLGGAAGSIMSPVWTWIRPTITSRIRAEQFSQLATYLRRFSICLSMPAGIMLLLPNRVYELAYALLFPEDALPGGIIKFSLILWWLVASLSGWARYFAVATRNLQISTYANIGVFVLAFGVGPVMSKWMGVNPIYIVPTALVLVSAYWWLALMQIARHETVLDAQLSRGHE